MSTATAPAPQLDEFEKARRMSGLKFTVLSDLTHIPYKRLWRFFREDGSLNRRELARLGEVLFGEQA